MDNIEIQPAVPPQKFAKIPHQTVGAMTFLTSFFYMIYWFYKQWKQVKKADLAYANIHPFMRGLLFPIYAFPLTKLIKREADLRAAVDPEFSAKHKKMFAGFTAIAWILSGSIIILIASIAFDWPDFISAGFGIVWITAIVYLQRSINTLLPENTPKTSTWLGNVMCVVVMILFIIVIFAGLFIAAGVAGGKDEFPCFSQNNKIEGQKLTNACMGLSVIFPLKEPVFTLGGVNLVSQNAEDDSAFFSLDVMGEEDVNPYVPQGAQIKMIGNTKLICQDVAGKGDYFRLCFFNRNKLELKISVSGPEELKERNEKAFDKFINSLTFFEPAPPAK